MKTLFVNATTREESRTERLAKYLLKNLDRDYEEVEIQKENLYPLTAESLNKRNLLVGKNAFDDETLKVARQFKEAETIVIASPYYDLSMSALLKTYLENINVVGLTFQYIDDDVPETLSKVKKVIYVMTAGGTIVSHDYAYGYVKTMFETFYGVKDFEYFYAEKLDLYGVDAEAILKECENRIDEYIKRSL